MWLLLISLLITPASRESGGGDGRTSPSSALDRRGGQRLVRIVRRGRGHPIRVRRATIILASSSGTPVPAIARLVAADEDTVRDVIHAFNAKGLHALDPQWAGGRPRLISDADVAFIVQTATTRPKTLGLPFTRWSVRKLAGYLSGAYRHTEPGRTGRIQPERKVVVGRERLRQILHANDVTFQRTRPGRSPRTPTSTPSWTG